MPRRCNSELGGQDLTFSSAARCRACTCGASRSTRFSRRDACHPAGPPACYRQPRTRAVPSSSQAWFQQTQADLQDLVVLRKGKAVGDHLLEHIVTAKRGSTTSRLILIRRRHVKSLQVMSSILEAGPSVKWLGQLLRHKCVQHLLRLVGCVSDTLVALISSERINPSVVKGGEDQEMVRTSVLVVGGLLAAGADAFMAPSAAGMWLSKPLLATRAQGSGMSRPRTSVPRSELRMGGALEKAKLERPELPMKRAFLWRYSELVLDKAIYFLQVAVMLIYRKILYKLAVKMNFAEEPDQTSSIRQDMIMDPRLFKASWDNEVNTAGVFAQGANGESYRIGTASQVHPVLLCIQEPRPLSRDRVLTQLFSRASTAPASHPGQAQKGCCQHDPFPGQDRQDADPAASLDPSVLPPRLTSGAV